jgi:alkylated DNA repair dioxygenase AlkB/SAM-dependent methyltransferase
MTRAECTSATAHVVVPGLVIVEEFCSEAQEAALMAVLTGPYAPWAPVPTNLSETGTMKRRVQHYGYVFDYKTADVLRSRSEQDEADCPAMPALPQGLGGSDRVLDTEGVKTGPMETYLNECVENGQGWEVLAGVIEKVRRFDFAAAEDETPPRSYPHLNQLTVNEYKPGEGIGSHVDTPSAFGDGLISLSLNAGIVMEFRKLNANKDDPESKKLVHLPRRSLLLMSGAARYEWEHMIVTRSTDMHNGEVLPRRLRVSLTLRTALDEAGSPMPLVQSNVFPPIWGHDTTDPTSLRTPACERDNVHAVYDAIAVQWHHTRGRRGVLWPGATQFLEKLEPGSIVADVGCGDGKYFRAIWNNGSYVIGTDISIPLLRTACFSEQTDEDKPDNRRVSDERLHLSDRPAVCAADCMSLPLRNDGCDAAICIAVLHHLSTKARRRRCIEELVRIVKPGGMINIQAWAITQEKDSRRKFAANDVYVPFNVQPKFLEGAVAGSSKEKTDERLLKSVAQSYSEAFNVGYDDHKGLVVFQRYCHLYRDGELEELLVDMANVEMVDSGFEAGNYFIILRVVS